MSGSQSATAHVDALLESYHAGVLSPDEAARVTEHLGACAACRERWEQIALYRIIRAAPTPTVGPELRQRVYARIAEAEAAANAARGSTHAALPARPARRAGASEHSHGVTHGGWLSGVAAALLVALLVSVFWALPHLRQQGHTSKQVGANTTTACPASATSATLPANAVLHDLALTSPTEGWAVGEIYSAQGEAAQGLILRYSNCHWTPVPLDRRLPGVTLTYISMDSPTDGWAIGNKNGAGEFGLLHVSGGTWSIVNTWQIQDDHGSVTALSMVSPNEGWLVTLGPDTTSNSTGSISTDTYRLWRYTQGSWTHIAAPTQIIDAIAPVGPDDLWIAGTDFVGATKQMTHTFAHYHNGAWTAMPEPAKLWTQTLHVVSPSDIWASGITTQGVSVIAHYDGVTWGESPESFPNAVAGGKGIGYALGDGDGWAFTFRAPNTPMPFPPEARTFVGSVLREKGGQWQSLSWPYSDINWLSGFSPASESEFWVIGTYYVDFTTPNASDGASGVSFSRTVLLHYVDGAWSRYG